MRICFPNSHLADKATWTTHADAHRILDMSGLEDDVMQCLNGTENKLKASSRYENPVWPWP